MSEKKLKIHWTDAKTAKLSGMIDEDADFSDFFSRFKDEVTLDLGQITGINSQGAHSWIKGVQGTQAKIYYKNLSVVLTEHICYNPRLLGFNPELVSFETIAYCESCGNEDSILMEVGKDITFKKEGGAEIRAESKCSQCASATELEPVPEDYLEYYSEISNKTAS